ncbi:hypothetical protein GCM10020367_36640 [Streptomyces sannanensis]|uniref:Uncharacterized protein n=1 Tax=Streptomyces sannanensis TaxID=285536 RepID=A0ABP6SED9_9ACTN
MGFDEDHMDEHDVLLVRDAMDRTTAALPPLPDLVGPAVAQGRRRTARVRLAAVGGVLCVAALGVAGAVTLPGDEGQGQPRATVGQASAPPTPVGQVATPPTPTGRPPVHIVPKPGETSMADLPPAERARQESFQDQAVGVLQDLLPEAVGTVQRTDLEVRRYQATNAGRTFVVIFSVRPSEAEDGDNPCIAAKKMVCATDTLPGGIRARASTAPTDSGTITETQVTFRYGSSRVMLSISPDEVSNTSAPVTNAQLLDVVKDPRFLDLVEEADRHPMEKKVRSVHGG